MDKTMLLDKDIENGKKVVERLDAKKAAVTSALRFYDTKLSKWLLLIGMKDVKKDGPRISYSNLLKDLGDSLDIEVSDMYLIDSLDPLLQLIAIAIRTDEKSISGIRFSGNTINNTYIQDAYIYRLSIPQK